MPYFTLWMLDFFNTIRVSNSLDSDHALHFVGSDLGPNCLQGLSADNKMSGWIWVQIVAKVISRQQKWAKSSIQKNLLILLSG